MFTATNGTTTTKPYSKPMNAIKAAIKTTADGPVRVELLEDGQPMFVAHGTNKEHAQAEAGAMLADLRRRWQ